MELCIVRKYKNVRYISCTVVPISKDFIIIPNILVIISPFRRPNKSGVDTTIVTGYNLRIVMWGLRSGLDFPYLRLGFPSSFVNFFKSEVL